MEIRYGHAGAPSEYDDVSTEVWAAENRAGTYEVTIIHPQYQTWSRSGIGVRWNERNPFSGSRMPEQVHVVAELEPLEER